MHQWQLLFFVWLISTTLSSLLYRRFAVTSKINPLVSAFIRGAFVSMPIMWTVALATGSFTVPTLAALALVCAEALMGVAYGVASFHAIKQSDASTFTNLVKLSVIPVVLLSSALMHESLTPAQWAGAALLLVSGFFIGKVKVTKSSAIWLLLSILLIAGMNVLNRYMVESVGLVTALTLSVSFGTLLHIPLARKKIKHEWRLMKSELPLSLALGAVTLMQIVAFTWATQLASNLSLLYSLSASKVVVVTIAAALFLGERDNISLKIYATLATMIGIVLL